MLTERSRPFPTVCILGVWFETTTGMNNGVGSDADYAVDVLVAPQGLQNCFGRMVFSPTISQLTARAML